jgi:DNA-directed RNA polymerase III subunit RPC1
MSIAVINSPKRKDVVVKSSAPKKVSTIQFCTLQNQEIQNAGEFEVTSKELFSVNGCMDPRLGISDKLSVCKTCRYLFIYLFIVLVSGC